MDSLPGLVVLHMGYCQADRSVFAMGSGHVLAVVPLKGCASFEACLDMPDPHPWTDCAKMIHQPVKVVLFDFSEDGL